MAEVPVPRYSKTIFGVVDPFKDQLNNLPKDETYRNKFERHGVKALYEAPSALEFGDYSFGSGLEV